MKAEAANVALKSPQVPPEVVMYHNGEPLEKLWATTRVGEFKGRFWAVPGRNELSVELRGRRVFVETFIAVSGFAVGHSGIHVEGPIATALHTGAIAALHDTWPSSTGKVRVRLSPGSAVGFTADK